MTKREIIEQRIVDNGITLFEYPTQEVKAMSLSILGNEFIATNPKLFDNPKELTDALYHEYYHLETNSLYTETSSLYLRSKLELKANTAMVKELVPIDKLKHCVDMSNYEIADYFNVSENTIHLAIEIYQRLGML